jgi:hypothetical protein
MPAMAGGVGLGLVFGWLAGAAVPVRQPVRAGGMLAAMGAAVAEVAAFGTGADAAACVAAMAVGGAARFGFGAAVKREVAA